MLLQNLISCFQSAQNLVLLCKKVERLKQIKINFIIKHKWRIVTVVALPEGYSGRFSFHMGI